MKAISVLQDILNGFDFSGLREILMRVIPALLCITLHELSHGYTAYLLGDDTAKNAGRLTLNPVKHIDPMGLLMMLLFRFGWAKPVPVNMFRFKDPKRGMAVTAFAGPVSNLLICVVFLFLYGLLYYPLALSPKLGAASPYVMETVYTTAYISLAMGIFNLLPIPPLDGSKVLYSLLPDSAYMKLMRFERYGILLLWALVGFRVLGNPLSTATLWLFDKLFVVAEFAFDLVRKAI